MKTNLGLFALLLLGLPLFSSGQDAQNPAIDLKITNQQKVIGLPVVPAEQFKILTVPDLSSPFQETSSGTIKGYQWSDSVKRAMEFYRLKIEAKDPNALLSAILLNRIAYGPTPDDLERLAQIGPQAYIKEQLAPWTIDERLALDNVNPTSSDWQFVSATGKSSSALYIYLEAIGDVFIDDIKLVAGSVPETGANVIRNGDFEAPLTTNEWTVSTNLALSEISTAEFHSGAASLHLVATIPGSAKASSIWQTFTPSIPANTTYTLSYWWKPGTNSPAGLVVRFANSGIVTSAETDYSRMEHGIALLEKYRAWYVQRAIQAKRQLLEVLLQFWENHFVTSYTKSNDYLNSAYDDDTSRNRAATRMEFMENKRWREALLNPQCTFYDLLKISAESVAMIIYLDTVDSKGNGSNIANENYGRELLELFTFGVDNGYDQNDITVSSRAWTGWSIRLVDRTNEYNAFSTLTTVHVPGLTNTTGAANLIGTWSFNYKQQNHNNTQKIIFPNKVVPDRFGAPYAGQNYQLTLPPRSGTNSIQDGYELIAHLANQPFTQEFISVKLCRLLVHDDFYSGGPPLGYDYTDPNLSAEGKLIRDCMRAWEENVPKGQIWKVLEVILNSELFRSQGAAMQKVKTPLEFTVSALRSLRAQASDGTYTVTTDGVITPQLSAMGRMLLFNRDTPDGYPEAAGPWISAGTLAQRVRFVQSFLIKAGASGRDDSTTHSCDPVKLLKLKLPSTSWKDAAAVTDYFLTLLYPAEGKANLDLYRSQSIQFLNTADDGKTQSLFSDLDSTSTTYETRVRGMVGMLLTLQRFQEQ
jgi:uncharacterized protein (DUF1800 family)